MKGKAWKALKNLCLVDEKDVGKEEEGYLRANPTCQPGDRTHSLGCLSWAKDEKCSPTPASSEDRWNPLSL